MATLPKTECSGVPALLYNFLKLPLLIGSFLGLSLQGLSNPGPNKAFLTHPLPPPSLSTPALR